MRKTLRRYYKDALQLTQAAHLPPNLEGIDFKRLLTTCSKSQPFE